MILHQAELRGVLDRDDPLVLGNEAGHDVEERRLAGAGTTGDEHVEACLDACAHEFHHLGGRGAELDVVLDGDPVLRELTDRHHGTVESQRRDDDVHA